MDPATEAAHSAAIEPNTDLTSKEVRVIRPSDSSLAIGSEPCTSVPIVPNWAPITEFSSTDIFQHSPLGDVLNSSKSLSLCRGILGRTMSGLSGKQTTKELVTHPPPT